MDILDGDAQTIWLSPLGSDYMPNPVGKFTGSGINVCWSKTGAAADKPALEIGVYFIQSSIYKVQRLTLDPEMTRCSSDPTSGKFACFTVNGACDTAYEYTYVVNFGSFISPGINPSVDQLIALRIRPVFNDIKLAVKPVGADLPEQGKYLDAIGQTESGVTRKWRVESQNAAPADFFDYALWSSSDIVKGTP